MEEYTKGKQTYHLGEKSLSGYEFKELFRNEGSGRFSRVGYVSGAASKLDARGFVPMDFDRDGDLDFFLVNNRQPWQLLENRLGTPTGGRWSVVQLRGTKSNSHGIGARVKLTAGGRTQVREIHAGSGYLSSPAPEAHFGLGAAAKVERLEIRWPSGRTQVLTNLEPDRIYEVTEGAGHNVVKVRP